jgi:hypothetical protein
MKENQKNVNYVGWLGHGNLGDESLYMATKNLFSPYKLVPVGMDCEDHSIISPVTIIGGSTGIPEWIEWLRPTKYNYIFGSGVKDPAFFGYDYIFKDHLKLSVMINKWKIFRSIGVRGEISQAQLEKWGIPSEVIGDPSFSLRPSKPVKKSEYKIAINLGSDGILWGMNEEKVIHEIAKVCRTLRKDGYELVVVPFWERNVARLRELAKEANVEFFEDWRSVESTLNLLGSCKVLIGEKLHALGFSAAAGTPFLALEYQPKCFELAQSVGFTNFTIRTNKITEKNIMKLFTSLLENYEEMRRKLNGKVEMYRRRQKQFANRIIRDLESLPREDWIYPRTQRRITNNFFWSTDILLHRSIKLWHAWNQLLFLRLMPYVA